MWKVTGESCLMTHKKGMQMQIQSNKQVQVQASPSGFQSVTIYTYLMYRKTGLLTRPQTKHSWSKTEQHLINATFTDLLMNCSICLEESNNQAAQKSRAQLARKCVFNHNIKQNNKKKKQLETNPFIINTQFVWIEVTWVAGAHPNHIWAKPRYTTGEVASPWKIRHYTKTQI